jgi:hypothetical protein
MTSFALRTPDLANLAGHDTGRDHVSHSALGTFLACQQRYGWSYSERLEPAVTATPLEMGRGFAHALEVGDPDTGEALILEDAMRLAEEANGNPWIVTPNLDDVKVTATIVREASRAYLQRYGTHGSTREVEMRVRIRNPHIGGRYSLTHDLLGRVDALADDGSEIIEDKLLGQVPAPGVLTQRLRLDRQVTIGAYLHWRVTGQLVKRVRYRITRKPSIRQRQNETLDAYLDRIAADYADRPDFYLLEETVEREADDFLRLEQELWTWVEQIREAKRTSVWPRNTAACYDHGGCAFLALCSREPGAIHQFREREQRPAGAPAATEFVEREQPKEAAAA